MASRAAYFSPPEAEILMEAYEEVQDIIKKKGNTATVLKQREKSWYRWPSECMNSAQLHTHRSAETSQLQYK